MQYNWKLNFFRPCLIFALIINHVFDIYSTEIQSRLLSAVVFSVQSIMVIVWSLTSKVSLEGWIRQYIYIHIHQYYRYQVVSKFSLNHFSTLTALNMRWLNFKHFQLYELQINIDDCKSIHYSNYFIAMNFI